MEAKKESIPGRLIIKEQNISLPIPSGSQSVVIGREDPVSGVFPDLDLDPHGGHEAGVGRRHAQLIMQNGQIFIEDLDSVNGTAVNKQRIEARKPHPIQNGDEIRLGKMILTYASK
jgi:pSer/pThr/pTyr-binding forkhead associated (FHA) protein